MRLATIDVGTNTALLLVADLDADGRVVPVQTRRRFVRLGAGVDAERRIDGAALERLRTALLAYRAEAEALGAAHILVAGTSASRDARNQGELIAFVREETGLAYEVLSGEEEATLSFQGAVAAMPDVQGACIVFDVGGGSTELVRGAQAGRQATVTHRCSLDIGAVRLTERFFGTQPPTPPAVAAAKAYVATALQSCTWLQAAPVPLIGSAGTAMVLALVHHAQDRFDPARAALTIAEVQAWRDRLLQMPYEAVLALNPALMDGRADVFPAGVLIVAALMQHLGAAALRVSAGGLRHGLAWRFAQAQRGGL